MEKNELDEVLQRRRETKREDLDALDHELFVSVGRSCIARGQSARLLDLLKDSKNQDMVRSLGCGLLGPLIKEALKKDGDPGHCVAAIDHVVQTCGATEVLNVLLKHVEDVDASVVADTVTLLMRHFQTALLMLEELKPRYLNLVLDALHTQICKLPVPYSCKQEEEDEHGFCRCCTTLLTFVQPFVQEAENRDAKGPPRSASRARLRSVLLKFCMETLREPLLQAQFGNRPDDSSQVSPLRSFASGVVVILRALHEPLPELLLYYPPRGGGPNPAVTKEDALDPPESRACLAYLLFVQLIAIEVFPAVFSPVFILQCNMGHVNVLLSRQDESWVLKGLDLHVKSLEGVVDSGLSAELLELRSFNAAPQNLIKIMTACPIQRLRVRALLVFQLLIKKLNAEARHTFFRIMVSLNLLRYLLISERSEPAGTWTRLCEVTEEYTRVLRVCLSMSRSYYGSELGGVRRDARVRAREFKEAAGKRAAQLTLVRNEALSGMPRDAQEKALECALVTYDLMESIIIRIEEIMNERP